MSFGQDFNNIIQNVDMDYNIWPEDQLSNKIKSEKK